MKKYDAFIKARYDSIVRLLKRYNYVDNELNLTPKGIFTAKIYSDELAIGEIFATPLHETLTEYDMLLILCALSYENKSKGKKNEVHFKTYGSKELRNLEKKLYQNRYLRSLKKLQELEIVTAFIYPMFNGKNFFDIIKDTKMAEGDLIRLYSQVLDRIDQVKNATSSYELRAKLDNCKHLINKTLEGISLI